MFTQFHSSRSTAISKGKHVSGLALMSIKGLLDAKIINETADGDGFDFVQQYVLPNLMATIPTVLL